VVEDVLVPALSIAGVGPPVREELAGCWIIAASSTTRSTGTRAQTSGAVNPRGSGLPRPGRCGNRRRRRNPTAAVDQRERRHDPREIRPALPRRTRGAACAARDAGDGLRGTHNPQSGLRHQHGVELAQLGQAHLTRDSQPSPPPRATPRMPKLRYEALCRRCRFRSRFNPDHH
jgi:hypothetical protein